MLTILAQQLGAILLKHQYKLATAESCTGGWIATTITAIAGSSQWFERGFITYSNAAKMEMLSVAEKKLAEFGAVSEATACQMAQGALQHSEAQVALSTTGIAGPGGGSRDKPVGTVCFAWALPDLEISSITQHFSGDREAIRKQAVIFALQQLLMILGSRQHHAGEFQG